MRASPVPSHWKTCGELREWPCWERRLRIRTAVALIIAMGVMPPAWAVETVTALEQRRRYRLCLRITRWGNERNAVPCVATCGKSWSVTSDRGFPPVPHRTP